MPVSSNKISAKFSLKAKKATAVVASKKVGSIDGDSSQTFWQISKYFCKSVRPIITACK
jgi:hypothetical protein